jgi:tetratricopeptide (TPR) repeat protein
MRASLLLLLLLGPAVPVPSRDPAAALREGNRRFHAGDLEGAMAAYAAGYDGSDPLLAYNLGTVAHHLERLPEALLWYRRAAAAHPGDPWLRENLELVREQLHAAGARDETGALWGFWMQHRLQLLWTGIILAWAALPALLLPRSARARRTAVTAVAIAAGLPFGAGLLLGRSGPQAAVLLRDCSGPAGRLPAGSEVRVHPEEERSWRVAETGLVCPDRAVGLVELPHP